MLLRYFVLGLFIATLALVPGVAAEDDVFCGDLPTADCDLLMANAVTMNALDSVVYDMEFGFDGIVIDGQPFEFAFTSDGTVYFGREEIDAVTNEVLDTTIREILKLAEENQLLDRGVELAERVLKAPAADINLAVSVPMGDSGEPTSLSAQLIYVDGAIYVASPLWPMMTPDLEPGQWLSLDLVSGMHMIVEMLKDPALLEGMMSSGGGFPASPGGGPSGGDMGEMNAFFAQFGELANAPYWQEMDTPEFEALFTQVVRLDDETIDGATVAVFQTTIDFGALAATEPFQQSFHDIYTLQTQMQGLTPEQAQTLESLVLEMLAGMDMTVTEKIGVDDQYTYGVDAAWSLTIETRKFAAAFTDEEEMADIPDEALAPMELNYAFIMAFSDHNQPVEITAPEESVPIIDLIMGMMPQSPMMEKS